MCNLSCISVPPVPLSLSTPPEGGCQAGTTLPHNFSSCCSPGLERCGQTWAEGRGSPCPSALLLDLTAATNFPCLHCFRALAGARHERKRKRVSISGVPGGDASCRGGSGHRVSSLTLVAAVLPAVEKKDPFIPTLAPPPPPPTSLAWWTGNACASRA